MGKYELATSLHWRYDSTEKRPITQGIERLKKCGFTNLDFPFLNMCLNPQHHFLQDNYLDWIKETKDFADSVGCRFVQAHAPCESVADPHDYQLLTSLCIKAIKSCAVLGVPWMVFHPVKPQAFGVDADPMAFNLKFFREMLPYAEKYQVGLAVEDTLPFLPGHQAKNMTDDMIALVDTLDSPYMGIGWDFGHAHLANIIEGAEEIAHQSVQLKKIGHRLKCTHVHDNNAKRAANGNGRGFKLSEADAHRAIGSFDEHIAPFSGDIDWRDVIAGLDAIDYSHYFTYEAHAAINPLPEQVADAGILQMYNIGQAILAMSKR